MFLYRIRRPPTPTLFPYTTLFRSYLRAAPTCTPTSLAQMGPPEATAADGQAARGDEAPSEPGGERRSLASDAAVILDRKSTRLNSSHMSISYAVFCLKKKKLYTD